MMARAKWVASLLAGLAAVGTPISSALAQPTGVEVGARLGYSAPLGKATDTAGDDLSNLIAGMVPVVFELGYRVIPSLSVGAYFQYGFGFLGSKVKDTCNSASVDCSVHDIRLGAQVQYHFRPAETVDPWLGLGVGFEWLSYSMSAGSASASVSTDGVEFVNLQGGLDFGIAPGLGVGPFVAFSLGQFGSVSRDVSGAGTSSGSISADIDNKALHQWLQLGVRGTFVL